MRIFFILFYFISLFAFAQSNKTFSVDYGTTLGDIKPLSNVTAGPGNALAAYKDARVKMIRTNDYYGPCDFPTYSNFFFNNAINPNFDPTNPDHYNWQSTDDILAVHHDNGFETFFRLGISFNLSEKSPYWDPPYDYGDTTYHTISEVFKRTVMHYNDGWDNGFHYDIRYWNIWTEPDGGFWNTSVSDTTYYRFYEAVTKTMKAYDASLKVGGPGLLSGSVIHGRTWIPNFIDYCKTHDAPLDFLSWHLYNQHNPYAINVYGAYIQSLLDDAGYSEAENIVTETNISLGNPDFPDINTPKHAAWFASMLISAQNSPIDRLFMYRGDQFLNLFADDSAGYPVYKWSGFGFKSFALLADEAPVQVAATGSEFVDAEGTLDKDTTNIMILASKTADDNACYVLISNYNSVYDSYALSIDNLPFPPSETLLITQYQTDAAHPFTETTSEIKGGPSLNLNIAEQQAPSVVLLKIEKKNATALDTPSLPTPRSFQLGNYPNPFNPSTTIAYTLPGSTSSVLFHVQIDLYDTNGRLVRHIENSRQPAGTHRLKFDASGLPGGVYLYRLRVNGAPRLSRKMVVIK